MVMAAALAAGGAGLWLAASKRVAAPPGPEPDLEDRAVITQREPAGALTQVGVRPRAARIAPSPTPPSERSLDPRIDRGAPWIRSYLSRLLSEPPQGVETSWRQERNCPVVKVTRGQSKVLECWAYDDYIRAAVHHPSEETAHRLSGFEQVEVRPPNRSGYVTVYVRGPEGVSALDRAVSDSSRLDG